jgi:hypothetical protein
MAALMMKDGGASMAPPKPKPGDDIADAPAKPAAKPQPKPADKVATR